MCQKRLLFGFGDILMGQGSVSVDNGLGTLTKIPTVSFHATSTDLKSGDIPPKNYRKDILEQQTPADVLFAFANREGVDAVIDSLVMFKNEKFPLEEVSDGNPTK
jgi:hypothetical protein